MGNLDWDLDAILAGEDIYRNIGEPPFAEAFGQSAKLYQAHAYAAHPA